jgi:hypothetical protein
VGYPIAIGAALGRRFDRSESKMRKLRTLALVGLALVGIAGSTAAFATSVYYPEECYWDLVWTYYGWQYQLVCY